LLADFFANVPESVGQMQGETAEVVSALPLNEQEQANIRRSVRATNITFRVDPTILGGLIIRVGDEVVDTSVASQMTGMREALSG
jgi:F-type H+-transporting ATPase subunit b